LHYENIHETVDGRKLLVLHGDHFDGVVRHAIWLAHLGDWAYTAALVLNTSFNWGRRQLGLPYWSLSAYLKHRVKNAVEFIASFEQAVAREARERGLDGLVCGHIHHAEMKTIGGVLYCNDGDWVESCTALTEDARGILEIVRWTRFAHERHEDPRKSALSHAA
jgi:UDP-2,3-diacylglucosamine pyrophosphatase LpxH